MLADRNTVSSVCDLGAKVKIYITVIVPLLLYEQTSVFSPKGRTQMGVFVNRMLREMLGRNRVLCGILGHNRVLWGILGHNRVLGVIFERK